MSVTPSNPKHISPLRARMIEDMTVRNFGTATQRDYIRAVKKLAAFLGGHSPDTASAEELRAFQVDLTKTGTNPPTMNATVTALRFFFKTTLDRADISFSCASRGNCRGCCLRKTFCCCSKRRRT